MALGNYGEALLRVADRLADETSSGAGGETQAGGSTPGGAGMLAGILSSDDQALVAELRQGLERIATGLSDAAAADTTAVRAALDGAELTMLGELVSGNEDQLPKLMPSFVFLVTLPISGQDRALELSERTADLVEEELRRNEPG